MNIEPDVQAQRADFPLASKAGSAARTPRIPVRQFPMIDDDEEINAAMLSFMVGAVGPPVHNQLEDASCLAMRGLLAAHRFVEFFQNQRPHEGKLLFDRLGRRAGRHRSGLESVAGRDGIPAGGIAAPLEQLSISLPCAVIRRVPLPIGDE